MTKRGLEDETTIYPWQVLIKRAQDRAERIGKLVKIEADLIRAIGKHSRTVWSHKRFSFSYIPEDKLRKIAQDVLNKLDKLK